MHPHLIYGKPYASGITSRIKESIAALKTQRAQTPKLAMVLVGDDTPSKIYVNKKQRACEEVGMESLLHHLHKDTSAQEIETLLDNLSSDDSVGGVLLQLPLPSPLQGMQIIQKLCPLKDVDGLTAWNQGKLALNQKGLFPCTPLGCLHLISQNTKQLTGLNVVVIGHSPLVGAPLAKMLLHSGCTVSTVHSESTDPTTLTKLADILVVAAGSPGLVTKSWVKESALVIDVGINRVNSRIVGDADYEDIRSTIHAITPVPGGVGPMTIAMLLANTMRAYNHLKNHTPLTHFHHAALRPTTDMSPKQT